jgi:hypothetical protein
MVSGHEGFVFSLWSFLLLFLSLLSSEKRWKEEEEKGQKRIVPEHEGFGFHSGFFSPLSSATRWKEEEEEGQKRIVSEHAGFVFHSGFFLF